MATVVDIHTHFAKPGYYRVKVTTKQPLTKVIGLLEDGTIKIALKAVPERGKANQELVRFLSQELGLPKANIRIASGLTSPLKIIVIEALGA